MSAVRHSPIISRGELADQVLRETGFGRRRKEGNSRLEKRELTHLAGWISAIKGKVEAAQAAEESDGHT